MAMRTGINVLYVLSLFAYLPPLAGAASLHRVDSIHGRITTRAIVEFHQPRLEVAAELLSNVSDPTSNQFGSYLSVAELGSLFAPSEDSLAVVYDWLRQFNISTESARLRPVSATLEFEATIGQLESLFATQHFLATHRRTKETYVDHEIYTIPPELHQHIAFAQLSGPVPVVRTRNARKRGNGPLAAATLGPAYNLIAPESQTNCSEGWTPSCIRRLYSIPEGIAGTPVAADNSIGIFGFGDLYNQTDLNLFFSHFAPEIPVGTQPEIHYINGAEKTSEYIDGEEDLDLQMAYPIVYPQKVEIFQTSYNGNGGIADDFLDAVDAPYCHYDGGDDPEYDPTYSGAAMCGTLRPTNVISISFAPDESGVSAHYVQRQCYEWMKLALGGITVLAAAGDRGVSGNFGCITNPHNSSLEAFSPLFPATCPYVTAVGAVQVNVVDEVWHLAAIDDPKHNFWGGGGFSNVMSRPKYQDMAVETYLSNNGGGYPDGTYNKNGRAIPDVALLGANVSVYRQGVNGVSGGTSAATPLFAAMINRINDERLLAGKKAIGFLNQILYQHPEVFTDIVQGNNPGCGTKGFEAAKGWDAVTGLGSPHFPALRQLLVSLR